MDSDILSEFNQICLSISRMIWGTKLIFYVYVLRKATNWHIPMYWVCSDMARNTQCTFKEMNLYYLKKKIFYTSLDIYRSNLLIQTFQTKMVKYISASPKLFECYVLQTLSVECNYFQDCFQACFFPVVIYYDAKHLV